MVPDKHQTNLSQYFVFSPYQRMGKSALSFLGSKYMFYYLLSLTIISGVPVHPVIISFKCIGIFTSVYCSAILFTLRTQGLLFACFTAAGYISFKPVSCISAFTVIVLVPFTIGCHPVSFRT